MNEHTIHLTDAEWDTLTMMCGVATGAAMRDDMRKLAYSFVKLTNKIHEGDPDWAPFEIPEKFR